MSEFFTGAGKFVVRGRKQGKVLAAVSIAMLVAVGALASGGSASRPQVVRKVAKPDAAGQGGPLISIRPGADCTGQGPCKDFIFSMMNPGPPINGMTIQGTPPNKITSFGVMGQPAARATGVENAWAIYPDNLPTGATETGTGTMFLPIEQGDGYIVWTTADSFATATRHDVKFLKPAPCKCAEVTAYVNKVATSTKALGTRLSFNVNWSITCTAGSGPGCKGIVEVHPPPNARFVQQDSKTAPQNSPGIPATVTCGGPCGPGTATGKSRLTWVATGRGRTSNVADPRYTRKGRRNTTIKIKLEFACVTATGRANGRLVTIKLHFNAKGNVDYKKSDLNGDGRPDGKELTT